MMLGWAPSLRGHGNRVRGNLREIGGAGIRQKLHQPRRGIFLTPNSPSSENDAHLNRMLNGPLERTLCWSKVGVGYLAAVAGRVCRIGACFS